MKSRMAVLMLIISLDSSQQQFRWRTQSHPPSVTPAGFEFSVPIRHLTHHHPTQS